MSLTDVGMPGVHRLARVSRELRAGGVEVRVIRPPYDEVLPLEASCGLERGTVVVLDLPEPDLRLVPLLSAAVRRMRATVPAAIALRVPAPRTSVELAVMSAMGAVGIGAALVRGECPAEALRAALTRPRDLPRTWVRWVEARRKVPPEVRWLLRAVIRHAPQLADIGQVCRRIETPVRTVARHLQRLGLPKLERWHAGARLMDAELALQREPELTVDEVAERLSYADAYSYSNRVYRLFGVTPVTSRRLLGFEWRFDAWWQRSGRSWAETASNGRHGF